MSIRFQQTVPLEERKRETEKIRQQYSNKLPIFLEKAKNSRLPDIQKNKCLAPIDHTVSGFIGGLRKKLKLPKTEGFFVFVNGSELVTGDTLMSELYERKKNEDGFLYMVYSEQEILG